MKIRDVMSRPVASCSEETVLPAAARIMWDNDCGALPVLNGDEVVGMITDRDICMAFGKRKMPSTVAVGEVMTRNAAALKETDDVRTALETMASRRVRRLPVVNPRGQLRGILSLDDLAVRAEEPSPIGPMALSYHDVFEVFRSICSRRPIRKSA
jgi:CBS domain-containing protein